MSEWPLLEIEDLAVDFHTERGIVHAVRSVSLEVRPGECLAVVGESGSGKSQLFLACLGLLAGNGRARGSARFQGSELIGAPERALATMRGARIGMVFQDPMNALTPHLRIGRQMTEVLTDRGLLAAGQARQRALQMLRSVGVGDPESRLDQYPHELSGGQQQRVAIAMALMTDPALLVADEPTTALDVTVQAQVLELLRASRRRGLALVLITHDLAVVASLADRVAVMYAGGLVEVARTERLYAAPAHPYTAGLLASVPRLGGTPGSRLATVDGQPPGPHERPQACAFAPRCFAARETCRTDLPRMRDHAGVRVACHAPLPDGWCE
ncbi:MAG: ABC transporter ATP-binding protein [Steroidobacteraceae bacterium]|nr:ABC transporter ATP-binding protein [Steroidobacteraceae bacterium]